MKASHIISVVAIAIFCCTGIAFSDNWKNDSGKKWRDKPQSSHHHRNRNERSDQRDYHRDNENRHDTDRRGDHERRPDYHSYHGYSEHPYENNRRYAHHNHKGHEYNYQGHWRSWEQWNRYTKAHPEIRKHGDYYRENAHLMFRFRDPVTGSYFFFSIGR